MKAGRKTKAPAKRKDAYLRVRLTAQQLSEIQSAAEQRGISVSAWTLERLLLNARAELKQ